MNIRTSYRFIDYCVRINEEYVELEIDYAIYVTVKDKREREFFYSEGGQIDHIEQSERRNDSCEHERKRVKHAHRKNHTLTSSFFVGLKHGCFSKNLTILVISLL